MQRNLVDTKGSQITIESTKWPGDYMMSCRFADGGMHMMFIKGVQAEVRMLLNEGYDEVEK